MKSMFPVALLSLLVLAGCQSVNSNKDLPQDPLFLSRKPFQATAKKAPPEVVAVDLPRIPSHPLGGTREPDIIVRQPAPDHPVPGRLTNLPSRLPARLPSGPSNEQ